MKAISRFIASIENAPISFFSWAIGFLSIVAIRVFLEIFSSSVPEISPIPYGVTFFHDTLFYVAEFLVLALILRFITREDIIRVSKVLTVGFCILWIAPIADLIISGGKGIVMSYLFLPPSGIGSAFLMLGGGGLTFGIRMEMVVAMMLCGGYAYIKTRKPVLVVIAAFSAYAIAFACLALPVWLTVIGKIFQPGQGSYSAQIFLAEAFAASRAGINTIAQGLGASLWSGMEISFDAAMGMIFFLIDAVLVVWWAMRARSGMVKAVFRNLRPERMAHYILMVIAGSALAAFLLHPDFTKFDGVAFVVLLLSFALAWCFAVCVNDATDVAIDAISNQGRPLVSGTLSKEEMKNIAGFFLAAALVGGYLSGVWAFYCICTFLAVFYIHATPPLRLKRIPLLASFLIAIASLASVLAGFYFVDASHLLADFPINIMALILISFTLGLNFKDMKDVAGDRAEGIMTIPVLFGEKYGSMATGILFACAFFAVPIILGSWAIFLLSLIAGIVGYIVIIMEPYREWRVFVLWFTYLFILFFILR
jgi:4-hydroxybenzoate polyprenyltransferase